MQTRQHRQIVAHVLEITRERMDETLRLADLGRIASVSQHSLRSAFLRIHGTPPYRYLRALRLDEARKVLLASDAKDVTVTGVAMRFGFFELGRFSVDYRRAFGESPSATLRRSSAMTPELARSEATSVSARHSPWDWHRFSPRDDFRTVSGP